MQSATPEIVSASGVTFAWSSWVMDWEASRLASSVYARLTRAKPGLSANVGHLDLGEVERLGGADLGVAVVPRTPDRAERVRHVGVGGAAPQESADVEALRRKEAGEEPALRREAGTRAGAAERLRHGRDHPHLTAAVAVAIAARHLSGVIGADALEGKLRVDRGDDLGGRDDVVEPPAVRVADVHVL